MDLREGQITVREILQNPKARALLEREFPALMRSPMLHMASTMPLYVVMNNARRYLSPQKLQQLVSQLKSF